MKILTSLILLLASFAATGNALAADRGDRVERRLDRRGNAIEARYDRRAAVAVMRGRPVLAARLEQRGDRIDRRLDRAGERYERRWDRRH